MLATVLWLKWGDVDEGGEKNKHKGGNNEKKKKASYNVTMELYNIAITSSQLPHNFGTTSAQLSHVHFQS